LCASSREREYGGGRSVRFKPLGSRVLLKPVEPEEATPSGIVLPDTAKADNQAAEVVAAGAHEDVEVSVGDVVVYRKYSGTEIELEGEDYLVVEAEDILGVVEDGHRE
jgi:chaperonin GroES